MSTIKECFTSRWGENGVIMEGDWSQLEIVGQAFLSGDEQMKQDIRDGKDLHCKRLAYKINADYDNVYKLCHIDNDPKFVKMRKDIKTLSFQRAYGAGVPAIVESTGMSKSEVQALINIEEEMYPEVSKYFEMVKKEVESSRVPTGEKTENGYPSGKGFYKSITGREYWFKEYDAQKYLQDRGTYTAFSPPQMKNYPVQGFSTADIVPLVLGKLYRSLKGFIQGDDALLINTVHDSIILDVKKKYAESIAKVVKEEMEKGGEYLNETFDIGFDLPLRAEVSWGPSWGNQTNSI